MSVETPEREPGEDKAFHEVDIHRAFADYFDSLMSSDAEALTYASHQLQDARVIESEYIEYATHSVVSTIQSGKQIPGGIRESYFLRAARSYVYSVQDAKPLLILNTCKNLGIDLRYLRNEIEPRSALIEVLYDQEENLYDKRQLKFLGKQAMRSMRLPSSRNIFRRNFS